MRVLVVGAGLAGLTTARLLSEAGCWVDLIEVSMRVGGRVRTVVDRFVEGQQAESGAEWVDSNHHRMRSLLSQHGMELAGPGQQWTTIRRMLHRNGQLLTDDQVRVLEPKLTTQLDEFQEAFERVADGIVDPSRPDLHPDAVWHDGRSAADVARELDLGALASLYVERGAQGEFAAEPIEVSSLFVAQQRAHMRAEGVEGFVRAHRVGGGLSTLVDRVAADLPVAISRGERLTTLRWTSTGAEVVTNLRSLTVDRVVLTCSLAALRDVTFDPPLPRLLGDAIDQLGYGTVTKTALQYASRSWPSGYATVQSPMQRVYEPTVDQPGTAGILMAYTGGNGGRRLAESDEADRISLIAAEVDGVFELGSPPIGGFSRAWSTEPAFGGSYAVYRPGQVTAYWQVLREPCGPVYLAGEHTATWTGYMEGAVESGERVVTQILGGTVEA